MTSPLLATSKYVPLLDMSKKSSDTVLYILFVLLLLSGGFLLYKFYTRNDLRQEEITKIEQPPLLQKPETTPKVKPQPKRVLKKPVVEKQATRTKRVIEINARKVREHEQKKKFQSKVTKQRFNKTAHIRIDWPSDLEYIETDIEDGMKTIYGYNHNTGVELTAVARPTLTSMEEVREYIRAYPDAIPNISGHKIENLSAPMEIPKASRKSGVDSIQVMQGQLDNGNEVQVAVLNRKDKNGSYVFIYSAPNGMMENNDGYFEQMYDSMRLLPKDKK